MDNDPAGQFLLRWEQRARCVKAVLDVGDGEGTAADSVKCPDTQGGVKCSSARWPTELLLFSAVLSRPE